jgi:TonB family protein
MLSATAISDLQRHRWLPLYLAAATGLVSLVPPDPGQDPDKLPFDRVPPDRGPDELLQDGPGSVRSPIGGHLSRDGTPPTVNWARPEPTPPFDPDAVHNVPSLVPRGRQRLPRTREVRAALSRDGRAHAVGVVKVCVGRRGRVDRIRTLKATGYPDHDAALVEAFRATRYRPVRMHGVTVAACAAMVVGIRAKR